MLTAKELINRIKNMYEDDDDVIYTILDKSDFEYEAKTLVEQEEIHKISDELIDYAMKLVDSDLFGRMDSEAIRDALRAAYKDLCDEED